MSMYGPKAQKILSQTMHEFDDGKLQSGKSETKVKSRQQAIAIGISKARQKGYKVPKNH